MQQAQTVDLTRSTPTFGLRRLSSSHSRRQFLCRLDQGDVAQAIRQAAGSLNNPSRLTRIGKPPIVGNQSLAPRGGSRYNPVSLRNWVSALIGLRDREQRKNTLHRLWSTDPAMDGGCTRRTVRAVPSPFTYRGAAASPAAVYSAHNLRIDVRYGCANRLCSLVVCWRATHCLDGCRRSTGPSARG